jgi:hypothetical protein
MIMVEPAVRSCRVPSDAQKLMAVHEEVSARVKAA